MKKLLPTLFTWIVSSALSAQSIEPKPFEYPFKVNVYDLPISSNGVNYRLYIREPLREPAEGEQTSAFYFLDALRLFVPSASMSSNYEYFNYIPSAYFIGIGYSNEADGAPKQENRTRDYTPTEFAPPDENHFLSNSPADYVGSGGTDDFLKVLKEELIPFVEENCNVGDDRVLIGNSLSGLAATHTVLTQPDIFDRYLIVSPSLWWDDWNDARQNRYVMKQASDFSADQFTKEARVYFAIGEEEDGFGMVTDLYVLVNALRIKRIPNLKLYLDVLEGEQHEGVFPSAFMKGIIGLYAEEEKRRPSKSPVSWSD